MTQPEWCVVVVDVIQIAVGFFLGWLACGFRK